MLIVVDESQDLQVMPSPPGKPPPPSMDRYEGKFGHSGERATNALFVLRILEG